MAMMTVKGYEFAEFNLKNASYRRALQLQNEIILNLGKIGVQEDSITIPLERVTIRKVAASTSWYFQGQHLYFSYKKATYMENLYAVCKVIELEVQALLLGSKSVEEFKHDFHEESDIEEQRKEARDLLGVERDSMDLELINRKYKLLAKQHHPDMGGDTKLFQAINKAHKMLMKELA